MATTTFSILLMVPAMVVGMGDPGIIYAAAPEERGAYHVGGKGVYNYGYNTGDGIAKVEVKHADGSVTGSYRYFDPHGQQIVRSYIADSRGFRVLGNELPSGPDTPATGFLDTQTLTGTVEGAKEFSGPSHIAPSTQSLIIQNRQFQGYPNQQQSYPHQEIDNSISQQEHIKIKEHQKLLAELEAKQKQILKEYQDKLEKHKQQIDLLQSQIQGFTKQNDAPEPQPTQHHEQVQTSQIQSRNPSGFSGYSSTFSAGAGGNYFYSDDNINYDFPAGFAYNLRTVPLLPPLAARGIRTKNKLTVGHTINPRHRHTPLHGPSRAAATRPRNNPYVIGYRSSRKPYAHG